MKLNVKASRNHCGYEIFLCGVCVGYAYHKFIFTGKNIEVFSKVVKRSMDISDFSEISITWLLTGAKYEEKNQESCQSF